MPGRRDALGRFVPVASDVYGYRRAAARGEIGSRYAERIARGAERRGVQRIGARHRRSFSGHGGEEFTGNQYERFAERASEAQGYDVRESEDFVSAYIIAFGYDPASETPESVPEVDRHESHGIEWIDSKAYASFLADWLDYDHDEIDWWLGYSDDDAG